MSQDWIPAFAGMTGPGNNASIIYIEVGRQKFVEKILTMLYLNREVIVDERNCLH
jgi:hypothetical protein